MIVTPLCTSSTYLILLLFVDSLNCQNFNIQYEAKEQAKLGEDENETLDILLAHIVE
jgi:hypothetical protein